MYRNKIVVILVDDKCIIPVGKRDGCEPDGGEPDGAVSTGVQGYNRFLITIDGPQLLALDHDFYVHGNRLSVAFFIDVPESYSDSFFRGHAFVTNIDS